MDHVWMLSYDDSKYLSTSLELQNIMNNKIFLHANREKERKLKCHSLNKFQYFFLLEKIGFNLGSICEYRVEIKGWDCIVDRSDIKETVINSIFPHPAPINMSINRSGRTSFKYRTTRQFTCDPTKLCLFIPFTVKFSIPFIYYWNLRID